MSTGTSNLDRVLRLEVPVIVRLGERTMTVSEVTALAPGSIIELPKSADSELDLLVNNKPIACGLAVKVVENFGLRITFIGDVRTRIDALGAGSSSASGGVSASTEQSAEELAEAMMAGQV